MRLSTLSACCHLVVSVVPQAMRVRTTGVRAAPNGATCLVFDVASMETLIGFALQGSAVTLLHMRMQLTEPHSRDSC